MKQQPEKPRGFTTLWRRYAPLRGVAWAAAIVLWVSLWYMVANIATITGITGWEALTGWRPAEAVQTTLLVVAGWLLTFLGLFATSRSVLRQPITKQLLGIKRLPTWSDIGLGIVSAVPYLVLATGMIMFVSWVVPGFNANEVQDVGFNAVYSRLDLVLAFLCLVAIAPITEELVFRGYLYGMLRARGVPAWSVWLLVSALFGLAHLQWNVGLNVFALSLVLCALRHYTGSIWAGILLHMLKNSVAFVFIFIAPGAIL